jgi:hypothetical protein
MQEIMRKEEKDVRNIFVKTRMNESEFLQLQKLQKQTTEKSLSNYLRKVVLQKPVMVNYRNQTADEFLKEMILLKNELHAIGHNYNQAVHKLHILDKIPEFRNWIQANEILKLSFFNKVDEIKLRINKLYEEWLQK